MKWVCVASYALFWVGAFVVGGTLFDAIFINSWGTAGERAFLGGLCGGLIISAKLMARGIDRWFVTDLPEKPTVNR